MSVYIVKGQINPSCEATISQGLKIEEGGCLKTGRNLWDKPTA